MIWTPQTDSHELSPSSPTRAPPACRETAAARPPCATLWPAVGRSFVKLDPRDVAHNPVMFVVEVGSAITTIAFIAAL